jgi:thioester reductase-like protein
MQKKLVNIWENILNTKPIGIHDNFFELGGDSLLAMNLNIELLEITDKISYSDIFHFPTIEQLEERILSNNPKLIFDKIENLSDSYVNILKNNNLKEKIKTYHPNNILLTGATGFLGIHILEQFIKNENCKIFCIVRDAPGITSRTKLHQKLNYYFGDKYDNLLDKRILAITGDITQPGFGLSQDELLNLSNSIDIVISSAALVLHYGNYENFYNTNVKSTKYIIDFCNNFHKKLYHISTTGVSGTELDLSYLRTYKKKQIKPINFDETCLYIGQILDNVYVRSKFEAESCVLKAISNGLNGYILRMGNLMPRYSDGHFQENIMDNAFITKLAAFAKIGVIPEYILTQMLNFTPVDYASEAIYKITTNWTHNNRIFHLYNNKDISIKKYLKSLKKLNINIEILSEKDFIDKINFILKNENSKNLLNNIINDFDNKLHINYGNDIIIKSNITNKYLKKTHFKWPKITFKYLEKFNNLLRGII